MKIPQTLFTLLLALAMSVQAETQRPTKEELARLIAEIPPREVILCDLDLEIHPEKAGSQEELSKAKVRLAKATEVLRKLRDLVTLGSSVLDYPGLLANQRISYSPHDGEYSFFVGAKSESKAERSIHWGFWVAFDGAGIITMANMRDRGDKQKEKADAVLWVEGDFFEWAGYNLRLEKPRRSFPPSLEASAEQKSAALVVKEPEWRMVFSPEALAERMSAATTKRDMVVAIIDKRLRMRSDEELKKLVDDLEKRLREIGFKQVIVHLATGGPRTPIYRE